MLPKINEIDLNFLLDIESATIVRKGFKVKDSIILPNIFSEIVFNFTPSEIKFILFVIAVSKTSNSLRDILFEVSAIIEFLKLNPGSGYTHIKNIIDRIITKHVIFVNKIDNSVFKSMFSWFSDIAYIDSKSTSFKQITNLKSCVYVRFSESAYNKFLPDWFYTNFFSVSLNEILNLKSAYSISLYILLRRWSGFKNKQITMPVNWVKCVFNVKDTVRYSTFKRDCFVPALNEITENTNLRVSFSEEKHNRVVTNFNIIIS